MARPVNADAEATRRRILASARQLFSERGIDGASVREIARGADVSLAMVHHYFGSKDELYAACLAAMDAELDELQRSLAAELAQGGSVPELLERAMRLGFRYGRAHQIETRLLMRHVAAEGELPEDRRERRQAPFLAESSAVLGKALGRDPASLRLPLQSLMSLTVRYAISSEAELCTFAGLHDPRVAELAVEAHLIEAARALLALPPSLAH